jgi:hypothetical protein
MQTNNMMFIEPKITTTIVFDIHVDVIEPQNDNLQVIWMKQPKYIHNV